MRWRRAHLADPFVGFAARGLQHICNLLLGGENNRIPVGKTLFMEKLNKLVRRIGLKQPWARIPL